MANPKVKIGLEIHGYLSTKEKLFCRCKNDHEEKTPNKNVCPVCTAQPGCKPLSPNIEAIKKIIQIGLILNCKIISPKQKIPWIRKHYDWPDLPKGYQNTMSGSDSIQIAEKGNFHDMGIREAHLEEDPASWDPETGCIDYNRSGAPLVEIVTEPDFAFPEEVIDWLKRLILNLSYIKAIDKKAGLKADVNVSINNGERVEIKNINSLENIQKAIEYEIERQQKEKVTRETRRYDPAKNKTITMRTKENLADYKFITDPDLPSIIIPEKLVKEIKDKIPESPDVKLEKMIKHFKIPEKQAQVLTNNFDIAEFFEKVSEKIDARFALDWVTIELLRVLNYNKTTLDDPKVNISVDHFVELLQLVKENKITELQAKQTLNQFFPKSFSPKEKLKGNEKITDEKEISKFAEQAIKNQPKATEDFKAGNAQSLNFLIGEVMKLSNKRADFAVARKVLEKILKK